MAAVPGALDLGARLPAAETPGFAGGGGGSGSAGVPGRRYKKAPQTRRTSLDRPLLLLLLPPRSSPPRRRRPAQGTRRCLGGVPDPASYSRERRARPGPGQDLAAPGTEWGAPRAALRLPPSGGQSAPHPTSRSGPAPLSASGTCLKSPGFAARSLLGADAQLVLICSVNSDG